MKRKAKEDAADLMAAKKALEDEKEAKTQEAAAKKVLLDRKIGAIGNYVHESVPVEQNEVLQSWRGMGSWLTRIGLQCRTARILPGGCQG